MEALNKIRDDTLDEQQKRMDLKKSRDDVIANRVKMAKARVRARQGLPPEEEKPVETGDVGGFFHSNKILINVFPTQNFSMQRTWKGRD